MARATLTVTPFPACLYNCVSLIPAAFALSKYSSGKPCNLQHSRGVNRRIRIFPSYSIMRLLCFGLLPSQVNVPTVPSCRMFLFCSSYATLHTLSNIATPCLSCAVKVKLGSPGSFIRLPFCRFSSRSGVNTAQQVCLRVKLFLQSVSIVGVTVIFSCNCCPLMLMQICNGVDFATMSAGARPWVEYTLPPCPCPQGLVLPIHLTAYSPVFPSCPPLSPFSVLASPSLS